MLINDFWRKKWVFLRAYLHRFTYLRVLVRTLLYAHMQTLITPFHYVWNLSQFDPTRGKATADIEREVSSSSIVPRHYPRVIIVLTSHRITILLSSLLLPSLSLLYHFCPLLRAPFLYLPKHSPPPPYHPPQYAIC